MARGTELRGLVRVALVALAALAALSFAGCARPMLRTVGYAAPNKVWYLFQDPDGAQRMIVCDVEPDGGESNCAESRL
jgi:hypothetical protein